MKITFSNSRMHSATQQMELRPRSAKTLTSWHFCWEALHCLIKAATQPSLAKRLHVALPNFEELPIPASLPRAMTLCSAERTPTELVGWSISLTRGYYKKETEVLYRLSQLEVSFSKSLEMTVKWKILKNVWVVLSKSMILIFEWLIFFISGYHKKEQNPSRLI